jgi:hypothetical protein
VLAARCGRYCSFSEPFAGEHSKPILKDLFKNFGNKSYKIFITVTDSGWMTKTVWEDVMEKFVALIKPSLRPRRDSALASEGITIGGLHEA